MGGRFRSESPADLPRIQWPVSSEYALLLLTAFCLSNPVSVVGANWTARHDLLRGLLGRYLERDGFEVGDTSACLCRRFDCDAIRERFFLIDATTSSVLAIVTHHGHETVVMRLRDRSALLEYEPRFPVQWLDEARAPTTQTGSACVIANQRLLDQYFEFQKVLGAASFIRQAAGQARPIARLVSLGVEYLSPKRLLPLMEGEASLIEANDLGEVLSQPSFRTSLGLIQYPPLFPMISFARTCQRRLLMSDSSAASFADHMTANGLRLIFSLDLQKRVWIEQLEGVHRTVVSLFRFLSAGVSVKLIYNGMTGPDAPFGPNLNQDEQGTILRERRLVQALVEGIRDAVGNPDALALIDLTGKSTAEKLAVMREAHFFFGPAGAASYLPCRLLNLPAITYGSVEALAKFSPLTRGLRERTLDPASVRSLHKGSGFEVPPVNAGPAFLSYSFPAELLENAVIEYLVELTHLQARKQP